MSTITSIILIYALFQIKHWLADFVFQTYEEVCQKGNYGDWHGFTHSAKQAIGTLVSLMIAGLWSPILITVVLLATVFDFIAHYHIDWIKVRFGTHNTRNRRYWAEFGADQLLHQLTYVAIIWYIFGNVVQ